MIKFIFDLDGTITSEETLPLISKHFNVTDKMSALTSETVKGNIPFIESFIKRVHILGNLPINEIEMLLSKVNLYMKVFSFIRENRNKCVVATGNLDCWVNKLLKIISCKSYTSIAETSQNRVIGIKKILKKEDVVKKYRTAGYKVIYIGEGNNDMEAMRLSNISIASGLTHKPANSVLTIVNYLVFNEDSLCQLLNQLL